VKYPPPPTRYGPGGTGGARAVATIQPAAKPGHAPPPTRFGPRPAPQAKAKTGAPLRIQPPPLERGPHSPESHQSATGTIQRSKVTKYYSNIVKEKTGKGRNYAGKMLGPIGIRKPRSFKTQKDAKFLRNLSTYFYFLGKEVVEKDDAEVEAMFVNNRLLIASNNPKTMNEIYDYVLKNHNVCDLIRTDISSGRDQRGQKTLESFSNQLMAPNFEVESRLILQASLWEQTKDYVALCTIRKNKLSKDLITSKEFDGKLIMITGLDAHAEQKLLLALIHSGLGKDVKATIRGKKRPCLGCWLCLSFVKDILGYKNLDFNPNPGLAWTGSIDSLKNFVKIAEIQKVDSKELEKWAERMIELHTKVKLTTYVTLGFGGTGTDQGYDTQSEDEE
jgi:hypothetical protein